MESHFLKAFDSELLSSKKTLIFVMWVPFRLHRKWKGLLSDLLCHQFSLFLPHHVVVFCVSSFLVQCIWWNTSLIFYLGFPEITIPCLFSKPSAHPSLSSLLLCSSPSCVSVLWFTFGLSSLTLYHLSQLSQSVLSPELSSSNIQRPFGQLN